MLFSSAAEAESHTLLQGKCYTFFLGAGGCWGDTLLSYYHISSLFRKFFFFFFFFFIPWPQLTTQATLTITGNFWRVLTGDIGCTGFKALEFYFSFVVGPGNMKKNTQANISHKQFFLSIVYCILKHQVMKYRLSNQSNSALKQLTTTNEFKPPFETIQNCHLILPQFTRARILKL